MINSKSVRILCAAAAGLMLAAGSAHAGVVGSKHDFTAANGTLGNPGGAGQGQSTATTEVCVFCHTPHGSPAGAPVPLWNKVLGTGTNYTRYSSLLLPSFTSEEAPVGSVSLACLSCHDGTQAMDVVLNRPGSGLYAAGGAPIGGLTNMTGTPVPMLGTDLSNDHPISMQYGGGGVSVSTHTTNNQFTGTLGDPDFVKPFRATINGQPVWWVDSPVGELGTRQKTDMLLYARTEADVGTGDTQPFVECGSCHDPHNDTTEIAGQSVQFLRIENTASQICTACHLK